MSQFTYFAHCQETGLVKIGKSKAPRSRVRELRPRSILFVVVSDKDLSEPAAHELFAESRVIGEWFSLTKLDVLNRLEKESIPFTSGQGIKESQERVNDSKIVSLNPRVAALVSQVAKKTCLSRKVVVQSILYPALLEIAEGRARLQLPRFVEVSKSTQPQKQTA